MKRALVVGAVIAFLAIVAVGVWQATRPPGFDEQYETLVGAELIGSTDLEFQRMSTSQTLAEAQEEGRATIYGEFDGPNERDFVVYVLHETPEAAKDALEVFRQQVEAQKKFYETPFYEEGDYHVVTPTYAQWGTRLDNVVMLGESWRSRGDGVDDRTLDQTAQRMLQIAMKNYLRLLGE